MTTDPGQADLVGRIAATFESAEDLIRALLQIARLDSQRVEMNVGPVSLGRLFQRLSIDVQAQAEARGLDLRFVPSSAAVLSDPVHLRSIAQNLISNALKYTVSGRVLVGVRRASGGVWLQVHDTGPGTPAASPGHSPPPAPCARERPHPAPAPRAGRPPCPAPTPQPLPAVARPGTASRAPGR